MLDCTGETVVAYIDRGEVCATRFGRGWIFPRRAFLESLDDLAREQARARRAAFEAKGQTKAVIAAAGEKPRRREPPALPSLPQASR